MTIFSLKSIAFLSIIGGHRESILDFLTVKIIIKYLLYFLYEHVLALLEDPVDLLH